MDDYGKGLETPQVKETVETLKLTKNTKGYNWEIKIIGIDVERLDKINEKMVAVIVTYEGSKSYPVEMYYTTVFPTLFFVDSSKELFLREPLYGKEITPEILEKTVGRVITHH